MLKYRYSKQSLKFLNKLERSDKKTAARIFKKVIQLSKGEIRGESLQGARDYSKLRVGKYRIISTTQNDILLVFIVEKRERVYQTFQHLFKNT